MALVFRLLVKLANALAIVCAMAIANAFALQCEPLVESDTALSTAGFDHGLLWRVDGNAERPSYIFGTIHISDPRVTDVAPIVTEAFNSSQSFVMEVLFDPATVARLSESMFLPDSEDLEAIVGKEFFTVAVTHLQHYGIGVDAAHRLKPWAAYMTLSMPPGLNSIPLDLKLMLQAQDQNLATFGLESVDEQISIFENLSAAEQRQLLLQSLCHYERFQEETERLIQTYIDEDLKQMLAMSMKYDLPSGEKFLDVLLWRRNRLMADRMQQHLDQGSAFIAIGALHLPGEGGVLDLLRARGYTLTPVNRK